MEGKEQRQQIVDFLRNVVGIQNTQLFRDALRYCYIAEVPKGKFLHEPDSPVPGPGFLMNGLLRIYGMSPITDTTHTDQFCSVPGQPVFPGWDSIPTPNIHVQALEASSVLIFPMEVARKLVPESMEAMRIFNRGAAANLSLQLELQNVLAQCDATQRYLWFLDKFPGLIYRVPHVYIASYLGITPVTLSRVRNSLRQSRSKKALIP